MTWISVKDRLPESGQYCWVHDKKRGVYDAVFDTRCPDYEKGSPLGLVYHLGFCIDEECGTYVLLKDVTHWMPHFYPEPPKDIPKHTLSFAEVVKGLKEGKKFKRLGNCRTIFAKSIKGEDERCLRTMANEDFDEDFWIISIEDIEATDWVEVP